MTSGPAILEDELSLQNRMHKRMVTQENSKWRPDKAVHKVLIDPGHAREGRLAASQGPEVSEPRPPRPQRLMPPGHRTSAWPQEVCKLQRKQEEMLSPAAPPPAPGGDLGTT